MSDCLAGGSTQPQIMNKHHCDVILTGDGPFSTSAMSTFVDQVKSQLCIAAEEKNNNHIDSIILALILF